MLKEKVALTRSECIVALMEGDCRHGVDYLTILFPLAVAFEDVGLLLGFLTLVEHSHRNAT